MEEKISELAIKIFAREMGRRGGMKSKRKLTREQAMEMIKIREAKKHDKN